MRGRRRAISNKITQSRPESGLGMSLFPGESLQTHESCSLVVRQRPADRQLGREIYGRDIYGCDIYGRDIYGRDIYGRDIYGRDIYGRDIYGRDIYGCVS